jgi:hypothetical protein
VYKKFFRILFEREDLHLFHVPINCQSRARGTLRIAVVNFDRESTAQWLGSTPMLPYIGNINDPFIAADDHGQLSSAGIVTA